MVLRGKKPTAIQKRLKAFFYGQAGAGKTYAAIQFPRPYLIDTERGAENDQYIKVLNDGGGAIFQTTSFDELLQEVTALLASKHDYKTLIIDPLTTLYSELVDQSAKKLSDPTKGTDGTEFGKHYGEANKQMKHLFNLLMRLDMNVIITSHAKNEYGDKLQVVGQTFDCYKKLDYLFDLVFRIEKRGQERHAFIQKTRIEGFPEGEYFPFSYTEIAKRYGKEVLERGAVPQELATTEQIAELKRLIELLNVPAETVEKWLFKAQSESFEEMPKASIEKCLDYLKNKVNNSTEEKI